MNLLHSEPGVFGCPQGSRDLHFLSLVIQPWNKNRMKQTTSGISSSSCFSEFNHWVSLASSCHPVLLSVLEAQRRLIFGNLRSATVISTIGIFCQWQHSVSSPLNKIPEWNQAKVTTTLPSCKVSRKCCKTTFSTQSSYVVWTWWPPEKHPTIFLNKFVLWKNVLMFVTFLNALKTSKRF